jgi:hypothetical protein
MTLRRAPCACGSIVDLGFHPPGSDSLPGMVPTLEREVANLRLAPGGFSEPCLRAKDRVKMRAGEWLLDFTPENAASSPAVLRRLRTVVPQARPIGGSSRLEVALSSVTLAKASGEKMQSLGVDWKKEDRGVARSEG